MIKIVLATANVHKAREIAKILAPERARGLVLLDRPGSVPEVDETGTTLEANARIKAQALYEATGTAALADDTGLFVDALGGDPGVRSARFAGEHPSYEDNIDKLLRVLGATTDRGATFSTVALLYLGPGREIVAQGDVPGTIATAACGELGFGYDPVFIPEGEDGRTFAQMSEDEKASCSHRGRAFRALGELLAGADLLD